MALKDFVGSGITEWDHRARQRLDHNFAQGGDVEEAPEDGQKYGRINAGWSVIVEGVNGTDGADGADGAPGAPGADGTDGVDGEGLAATPGMFSESFSTNITTSIATIGLDAELYDPDTNYSVTSGEVTVTAAGGYFAGYNVVWKEDGTAGNARGTVETWVERDQGSGSWTVCPGSIMRGYMREHANGGGNSATFFVVVSASEKLRMRVISYDTTDISTEANNCILNIFRVA